MTIVNPLLLQNPIEKIGDIEPDYVVPAISKVIEENRANIEALVQQDNFTWRNFMLPMEKLEDRLSKAWSPVSHLNSVCNSNELRQAYDKGLALLTEYTTQLGQHRGLYKATKSLYDSRKTLGLSDTQVHILKHSLIGFKLSGLHLQTKEQKEFAQIQARLAELESKFEQNLLDATMAWSKTFTDASDLVGLPETELAMLAANAEARNEKGYLVTLEIPSYVAVVNYADNRELRKEIYTAYITRASELGPNAGKFDNSDIMAELLRLKNAKAGLLGYENYAELSLETKMAQDPEEVLTFLQQLNSASHQQAKREFAELKAFAKSFNIDDLQAWDIHYFSEKLKEQNYQISQSELRPYFPVNKVIKGLFELCQHHFDINFELVENPVVWHPDVRHYLVKRSGTVIAEFYFDLYARRYKRGGAWMDDYCGRFKLETGEVQNPVAYLNCNFAPPIKDKPALLTHDEVVTLFHEFGHGIHHMLTQVDELSASGIENVPWDAVELPSQFMENFCYQPEVIDKLSEHFETGEPLPKEKLDKLIAAKNFQSALMMLRQLEFGLFDMRLHMSGPLSPEGIRKVLDDTRSEVSVIIPPSFNRFQNSFAHIFSGGYSAGYYSYKWAEILSADAFSLFEEVGVMNPQAGQKFCKYILEKGGSAEPMDLFVAFRGRKPEIEPLLRHSGIK